MRPIFTIYVVAGLIFLLAMAHAGARGYHAYATKVAIAALAPGGSELERMRNSFDADVGVILWSTVLAISQIMILFAARKLNGKSN